MPTQTAPIAVVVSQLGYGGAERQTVELLKALTKSPMRPRVVVILSDQVHPNGALLTQLGYPVEVLTRHGSYDPSRALRLRRLLVEYDIELVHAVHLLASAYAWLATRFGAGRWRSLPTFRGAAASNGRIKRAIYARMFRDSSVILVNSHCGAAFLEQRFKLETGKIRIVPNGLDVATLVAASAGLSLRHELGISGPIIGFVGKNSRVKNLPRFLEVFSRLLDRVPDVHAVLIGHGLEAEARPDLAPQLPPDRVHFLGPRDDAPRIIRSFDVLVLTSDSEGCPNAVLEACVLGTPVVASDVGDVRRILQLTSLAAAVSPSAVDSYVSEIVRLLREADLSDAALNGVRSAIEEAYGMGRMIDETTAVWAKLLKAKKESATMAAGVA